MRPSLLIIDDDEHVGVILKRVLADYDIVLATSAEEGLQRVAERPFEGILCDLSLPGKSGVDFYARVAELRADQERRVRFITGGVTDEDVGRFVDDHAHVVLQKPFELGKLRAFVAELVRDDAHPAPGLDAHGAA